VGAYSWELKGHTLTVINDYYIEVENISKLNIYGITKKLEDYVCMLWHPRCLGDRQWDSDQVRRIQQPLPGIGAFVHIMSSTLSISE